MTWASLSLAQPTPVLALVGSLIGGLAVVGYLAWAYRKRALKQYRRAERLEAETRRMGLMLRDALMDAAEQESKLDGFWDKMSPRLQAIDEARAKCAGNLSPEQPVGTFADPLYIQRTNVMQDDWAWVSTIDELCPNVVEGE